jgi:hypothetical protein
VERDVIDLILSTRETALNGEVIGLIVRSGEMELIEFSSIFSYEPIRD